MLMNAIIPINLFIVLSVVSKIRLQKYDVSFASAIPKKDDSASKYLLMMIA